MVRCDLCVSGEQPQRVEKMKVMWIDWRKRTIVLLRSSDLR